MAEHQRVIIYGQSIILGTMKASLARYSDLDVIELPPPLPDTDALRQLQPDVILFDMTSHHPDPAFELLRTCPQLLLIGVNPESGRLVVWSSEQGHAYSVDDLVRVINRTTRPQP